VYLIWLAFVFGIEAIPVALFNLMFRERNMLKKKLNPTILI